MTDSDEDTPLLEREAIREQYHSASLRDESYVHTPKGFSATAHISLWEPEDAAEDYDTDSPFTGEMPEVFRSSLRLYSFKNLLESHDAQVLAVCLVPTQLSRIYMQVQF